MFPKSASTRYGYYTLSYHNAKNGTNGNIQGGMNEAGLTFDFNALEHSYEVVGIDKKKRFPKGDAAILPHILANLSTAQELVSFFNEYWFMGGFTSAQMHVADRFGHFAIVSPSGSRVISGGKPQVSTNFRVCGGTKKPQCVGGFPLPRKNCDADASLASFTNLDSSIAKNGGGSGTFRIQIFRTSALATSGSTSNETIERLSRRPPRTS